MRHTTAPDLRGQRARTCTAGVATGGYTLGPGTASRSADAWLSTALRIRLSRLSEFSANAGASGFGWRDARPNVTSAATAAPTPAPTIAVTSVRSIVTRCNESAW